MADEVVGGVRVDVYGNTDPLKRDIRQAAAEAGKSIDENIGEGAGGTAITDNIVEQVADAEKPAGKEAQKVGRAIVKGIDVGSKDIDIRTRVNDDLRRAEAPLREQAEKIGTAIAQETSAAAAIQWARNKDAADLKVRLNRNSFRSSMDDAQEDWSQFGKNLQGSLDKSVSFSRLFDGLRSETGSSNLFTRMLPGGREGAASGKRVSDGMKKSILQAGVEKAFMGIFLKAATLGPLIGGGVRAAAPILTGLAGQVSVITTGLAGLGAVGAASVATMIPAVGALKIAFAGLDAEAKKALTEKFTAAAGDLAGFKERVRNEIVPALVDATKTVSKLAPEINKMGKEAAKAGGEVAQGFATMLVGRKEEIGNIFGNAPKVMKAFGTAGSQAFDVILNALDALQPLVMRTVSAISHGVESLTRSLNLKIDSGAFAETMEDWYQRGVLLLQIFRNLGSFLGSFFGAAADSSDSFLESFRDLTGEWAAWADSVAGQNTLKQMFDDAVPVVKEVWGLLGDIAGLFTESFTADTGGLVDFIQGIRTSVIPGLEALQDTIRDSGIQEALFDMADAVLHLFNAFGGTSLKVFVTVLASFVEVLADVLDALGPVLVPLGTFIGLIKALTITKAAFSGLLALPEMLLGIAGPAAAATTAVEGVGGAAAVAGKGAGKVGLLSTAVGLLGPAFAVAAGAYGTFQVAGALFNDEIESSSKRVTDFVEQLGAGRNSISLLDKTNVGTGWGEKFAGTLFGVNNELTGTQEILRDLGGGFASKASRFLSGFTGDAAGIQNSRAALQDMFGAIEQGVQSTGDVKGAEQALSTLVGTLERGGVSASEFAPGMQAVQDAIDGVKTSIAAAGETGLNFTGDFKNDETAVKSFGIQFDKNVTDKLAAIRADRRRYGDPVSGGLNPEGIKAQMAVIKAASIDTINGVSGAIGDTGDIFKVLNDKASWDKFGELTTTARDKLAKLMPEAAESGLKALAAKRADFVKVFDSIPISVDPQVRFNKLPEIIKEQFRDVGAAAIRLYIPPEEAAGVTKRVKGLFGQKIQAAKIAIEAEFPDLNEDEINAKLAAMAPQLFIDANTEAVDIKMDALMGQDWGLEVNAAIPDGDLIEVDGKLMEMTAPGKWEAVVGTDADTARAKEKVWKLVNGKWELGVKVDDNGTAEATGKEIDDEIPKDKTVNVKVKTTYQYYDPRAGGLQPKTETGQSSAEAEKTILIPPSSPPTISPGGPTTMGFGAAASISPFAGQRAVIRSAPGSSDLQGSTNVWTGQDKDKGAKNVTINNYYPTPERASDTIAMQMRIARYA